MKIIDKYIIKKFLSTFILSVVLLIFIIIAFDVSEKIDDFIEQKAPISAIIWNYYFNFIPYFINLFSPLFVFISVVFVTSKLASNSEIVAILTGGLSFKRMLYPFVFVGILLAVLTFVLQNFLIPPANKERLDFEWQYIRTNKPASVNNIHTQISYNEYVYLESFTFEDQRGINFTLESIDFDKGLTNKLSANVAQFDSIRQKWILKEVYIRKIADSTEKLEYYPQIDTTIDLTAHDFSKQSGNVEVMNFFELNKYINKQKLRGADNISFIEVERHRRISFPFATIILTLIGVALSCKKTRGGTGLHIGIGITLSFGYILLMQFSSTFATNGNMPPMLAVWIPNIIFSAVAYFLIKRAPK